MNPEALTIWAGLEFRKPMLLRNVEPLSEDQMLWIPGPDHVSIAWQLWHIAEVEDNWICDRVLQQPLRFPFDGVQVRKAQPEQYPSKAELIRYLHEVRELTRQRLEEASESDFNRQVGDADFGKLTVRDLWAGVVTSFAWHAGQIALTAKLLPNTPIQTMSFGYWKSPSWRTDEAE